MKEDPPNTLFGGLVSDEFSFLNGYDYRNVWRLYLYLNNNKNNENKDWISLYVKLTIPIYRKVSIDGSFFIINNTNNAREYVREINKEIVSNTREGFYQFIEKKQLIERKDTLLINDVLTVGVEFTVYDDEFRSMTTLRKNPIAESIKELYETRKDYDFIITVENRKFKVHKIILIARCPVFSAIFAGAIKEGHKDDLSIADIKATAFSKMLEFIYTDQVTDVNDVAIDLLDAAEKFQLKVLKQVCENSISRRLTVENAIKSMQSAERNDSQDLFAHIINFIAKNAASVIETKDFVAFEEEKPSTGMLLFKQLALINKDKN
ncbi:TD and POZ domain-containing protein 1-like [Microplitis mediator]|uniref:TD and POZ domain-containing protein 1-like n=1 Tax=Microplitis mediator TaxID=375433 RepID=UPI0025565751|nr:TD and POZ domain-containing protein 1-like [Microplitis mediator]